MTKKDSNSIIMWLILVLVLACVFFIFWNLQNASVVETTANLSPVQPAEQAAEPGGDLTLEKVITEERLSNSEENVATEDVTDQTNVDNQQVVAPESIIPEGVNQDIDPEIIDKIGNE